MKILKFAAVLAVAGLSISANAQRAFDAFQPTRTLILGAPTQLSGGNVNGTNLWVDTRTMDGVAKLDIFISTNANSTVGFSLQQSADQTTVTAVTSAALAVPSTVLYTNTASTNQIATNVFNLYGAVVTPTAATSGWATPYINPAGYTTTLTAVTPNDAAVTTYGINIADLQRYVRIVWTTSGSATNAAVAAVLTAYPSYSSYPY